jgi:RNA polymerase sigma-70 factor (ECF subfamily)
MGDGTGTTASNHDYLVRQAVAGDRRALESLLLEHHDSLLRFVRAQLSPADGAWITPEDILQETFIEAFRRVRSLETHGRAAFLGWLRTIARTRLINQVHARNAAKRGGGRPPAGDPFDATATSILQQIAGRDPSPSLVVRRKEALKRLAEAIAELDSPRQHVLNLRYKQGLPIAEIARETGKTEGAIKMLISRTIDALRQRLAADGGISLGTE